MTIIDDPFTDPGKVARHRGEVLAIANAVWDNPDCRADLYHVWDRTIAHSRRNGTEFTADTIRDAVSDDTRRWMDELHPNTLPALFGQAAKKGAIEQVSRTSTSRASRHYSRNGVWRATRKDHRHDRAA